MSSSSGESISDMEVADEEEPYVPGVFEGASGRCRDVLNRVIQEEQCEVCASKSEHEDYFALCNQSQMPAKHQDPVFLLAADAYARGMGWCNYEIGYERTSVCVMCCEKKMQRQYTVKKGRGLILTSEWRTLARSTKPFVKVASKKLQKAMQTMDYQINRHGGDLGEMLNIEDVDTLTESNLAREAADWVTELADGVSILYGCTGCGMYPLKSSSWWRCNVSINSKDGRVTGGHWRCAGCLQSHSGETWPQMRLLVMGDGDGYTYFKIGRTSSDVDAKIRFLQMVRMVTPINGMPVSKEVLLNCIAHVNNGSSQFASFKEVVALPALDPAEMRAKIFCSDARLYLSVPGQRFQALDLKNEEPIEILGEECLHSVMDFAFGLTNWREKWPSDPRPCKVSRT
jgi:hypothetical protein